MGLGDAQIKAIGMATVSMAAGLASTALAAKAGDKSVADAVRGDLGKEALTAVDSTIATDKGEKENAGQKGGGDDPTTNTTNTGKL
jgi:hypothetical protein